MPITTAHRPYSQSNLRAPNSPWVLFTPYTVGMYSIPFEVRDQPVIIVAAGLGMADEIALQVTPDATDTTMRASAKWADFYLHTTRIQLSGLNVMVVLRIPGTYRLRKIDSLPGVTVTAQPATLTHEPRVPLVLPAAGTQGPQGPQGVPGASLSQMMMLEARVSALEGK